MLEIKNYLVKKDITKDYIFEDGINFINKDNLDIFKYLYHGDIRKISFELLIDGQLFKQEDNQYLYFLKIDAKVISLMTIFLLNGEINKSQINRELFKLKELKIATVEERNIKRDEIFKIINKFHPIAVLINLNDTTNDDYFIENRSYITNLHRLNYPLLSFEQEGELKIVSQMDSPKKKTNYFYLFNQEVDHNKSQSYRFKKFYINNWLIFLISLIANTFLIAFSSAIIPSFNDDSLLNKVLLIIVTIVFFLISLILIIISFDFTIDQLKDNKKRFKIVLLCVEILNVLGAGLGIGISFLMQHFNILITDENYTTKMFIIPIIIFGVLLIIPFISKYINMLIKIIKDKLFKKK